MATAEGLAAPTAPRLSICIATFRRGRFIGETLDSVFSQLEPGVEVVVVDGCSPDDTEQVMAAYVARHPQLRYVREAINSGVDGDYDKAVGYARGDYCWLMTDDDLLADGAIRRVLEALASGPDLLVVNSRVESEDFSRELSPRLLQAREDRDFDAARFGEFFAFAGKYLSFIGAVVIRRATWLERSRDPYFGTLFIHFGVIFQDPGLASVRVLAEPLIRLRYGNSMWTPRALDIWLYKWPRLVWSFPRFTPEQRAAVSRQHPWQQARKVFMYRALGAYGLEQYREHFRTGVPFAGRMLLLAIALVPGRVANALSAGWCLVAREKGRMSMYDLVHSRLSNPVTRLAAKVGGA